MQISELAQRTSVSVHALRHYERLGLLQPRRRANGYRDYPAAMQREVVFIAMSRQLGFTLPQIAPRLAAYRAGTLRIAAMVDDLRQRALALDQQIAGLKAQKQRVLEHEAWLETQRQTAARRATAASPAKASWPRVRPVAAAAPASVSTATRSRRPPRKAP
ncbi:MerR family DNA-binding transcriptional regulator [Acidovorax sp. sic0104]|uniref:MerR family DNA-binding transcriptional regulator n=1 Tax=Acidovorax sp. sic0104 TaxID=2854784 RepID=UPI001C457590|nr:MerR family DNA-binding transcriptional regulator [Acidovorax sp. sic0104]MBV7542603.1 MerR family DNA-binding transcriptional regulator [Acidovorax sp. sic0104]